MQHSVRIEYTPEIVTAGVRRFWIRTAGRDAVLGAVGLIAGATAFMLGYRHWLIAVLIVVFALLLLLAAAAFLIYRQRSLRRLRDMGASAATWTFAEDGLSTETPLAKSQIAWSLVKRLWRFPDVWILAFSRSDYSLLPADGLSAEVREFIATKVREHGGTVA